jgi:AI-2 transport protein TqsA
MTAKAVVESSPALRFLVGAAAAGVLLIVLKTLSPVLVPFLQAAFVAVIAGGPVSWLHRRRLPLPAAVALVFLGLIVTFWLLGLFLSASVREIGRELPAYEERLRAALAALAAELRRLGIDIAAQDLEETLDPGALLRYFARWLRQIGGGIAKAVLVAIIVLFALLEGPHLSQRLKAARRGQEDHLAGFNRFAGVLNRYLLIKTWMSLATGATLWAALSLIGVDFPLLWGLLAFLLNYIPNLGSLVAAAPPILIAFLKLGAGPGFATALVYLAVNVFYSNLLEPRLMGISLGLSPVLILFSLVLWGWTFGLTGVFLAVPLTMTVKLVLESCAETRHIAALLGSHVEIRPGAIGEPPARGGGSLP